MGNPPPKLHVVVYTDHDIVHNGHLTGGLFELEAQNLLSMRWHMPLKMNKKLWQCTFVRLSVHFEESGETVKHCFDFHDHNHRWDEEALAWCDIYWKSNYRKKSTSHLTESLQEKFRPYGLYFPFRSRHSRRNFWRLAGSMRANLSWRHSKGWLKLPHDIYSTSVLRYRRYMSRLTKEEYEATTSERPVDVYFHPGCWPMTDERNRETNFVRQKIIQQLRQAFGTSFVGGFVSNSHSLTHFPNEIYPHSTNHQEYVRLLQQSRIVISTNGLDGCHSWRTGEALASGAVLVTEKPLNDVDDNYVQGKTVFFYQTPEECVALCQSLLRDHENYTHIQAETHRYYENFLEPGRTLLPKLLARCVQ